MGWIGNAPSQGLFNGGQIVDGTVDTVDLKDKAVTSAKLGDTAIADKLGYTPANAENLTPTQVSDKANTSTGAFDVPSGTTAERPASPGTGYTRFNTTTGYMEYYNGSSWLTVAPPPTISSVSPTVYSGEQGTSFVITGSLFESGASVKFITNSGVEYAAATATVNSATQITATTPQDFTVANEPLTIRVTNSTGLSVTLAAAIDCGNIPTWTTASGSLGSWFTTASVSISISASDSDAGSTKSYSIVSGALPTGLSLNNSTGAITGAISGSAGTYSFTARVTDNAGNIADRAFSIVVFALPSGGTVTTSGGYRYHYFSGTANFYTDLSLTADILVVGGGGASSIQHSGGAGAGGLVLKTGHSVGAGNYVVTVGGGGVVTSNTNSDDNYRSAGANGSDSSAFGLTALGGGGARPWALSDNNPGNNGGSGGAPWNSGTPGQGLQPSQGGDSGTYGFGNRSGNGAGASGGGAGAVGNDGAASTGGAGKYISQFSQFGVSGYFAGGGGGGNTTGGSGGSGGGGGGVPTGQGYPPVYGNGTANTGGGGGGCGDNTTGGSGGSGVVIVRYAI